MRTNYKIKDAHGAIVPETPLRLLIKTYPDLAEEVFNNCITNESIKDPFDPLALPSNCLKMNYEFIDDAFFLAPPETDEGIYSSIFKSCFLKQNQFLVLFFTKAFNLCSLD